MPDIIKIPEGTPLTRFRAISAAMNEYIQGVHETRKNAGDGVDKYGHPGWEWCLGFCMWCLRQAGVDVEPNWSTQDWWKKMSRKGLTFPPNSIDPRAFAPGNIGILKWNKSKGHAVMLLSTIPGTREYYTIEGNTPPRGLVAVRRRSLDNRRLLGFVNPYPPEDQPGQKGWGALTVAFAAFVAYMLLREDGNVKVERGVGR